MDLLIPTTSKMGDVIMKEISVSNVKWRFQEIYQLLCIRSDSGADYPAISSRMKCNAEANMRPKNFYTPDICEEALKALFEATKNKPQIAELSKMGYSETTHLLRLIRMYREFSRRSKEFIKKTLISNKFKNMLVAVESKKVTPETREKARAFCGKFSQLVKLNNSMDSYDGMLKKASILEKLMPKRTELPTFRILHASLTQQYSEEQRKQQEALINAPTPSLPKNPINASHTLKPRPSSQFIGDKNVPKSVPAGSSKKPSDSSSTPRTHPRKQNVLDLPDEKPQRVSTSRPRKRPESTTPIIPAILPTDETPVLKKKRLLEPQSVAKPTTSKLLDSSKQPPQSEPRAQNKPDSKQQKRSLPSSSSKKPVAESKTRKVNAESQTFLSLLVTMPNSGEAAMVVKSKNEESNYSAKTRDIDTQTDKVIMTQDDLETFQWNEDSNDPSDLTKELLNNGVRSDSDLTYGNVIKVTVNMLSDNFEDPYADRLKDHPLFKVLKEIREADVEGYFRYPVTIEVPEYPDWIETPMDILTIEDLILNGNIKEIDDLECYANLICANACTYGVITESAEYYAETLNEIFERYRDAN